MKKRGSAYYEIIIKTLVFITLIATAISFFGVFTTYLNVNYADAAQDAMAAFKRMEEKADNMLDRANSMAELNSKPVDEAKALEKKYETGSASVEDELAELKKKMGL